MLAEPGKSPDESLSSDSDSYNGEYSDDEFYDDQEMDDLSFPKRKKEPEEVLKELPEELREGALKNLQPFWNKDKNYLGGHPPSTIGDDESRASSDSPRIIYKRLNEIKFNSDDPGSSKKWSGSKQIDQYINQAIGSEGISQELAYYIAPTLSGFGTKERIEDVAELLCKRKKESGKLISNLYGESLDKPCIVIANTDTTYAKDSTDFNKSGGSHWVSWVLLPKKYESLSGKEVNDDKYKVYFFDSLEGGRSFPERLKKYLIEGGNISKSGGQILSLSPFCEEEEIEVVDISHLIGHQEGVNGSDCGWWAVYYALMTVYTGGVEFLKLLEGNNLSAAPLREIMNLQESYRSPSQSTEDTPLVEMVTPNTKSADEENASPQRSSPSLISNTNPHK